MNKLTVRLKDGQITGLRGRAEALGILKAAGPGAGQEGSIQAYLQRLGEAESVWLAEVEFDQGRAYLMFRAYNLDEANEAAGQVAEGAGKLVRVFNVENFDEDGEPYRVFSGLL